VLAFLSIMKFSLVFDKSGDTLPFEVVYNHELFEFFVEQTNKKSQNSFANDQELYKNLDKKITHLHWAISKTNEVFYDLVSESIKQHTDLENYLDQRFLNKLHSDWVFSHYHDININDLRFSSVASRARLGNILHELYPDTERIIKTAPAMDKLGYIYPYREINLGVHNLENSFTQVEFKADEKWQVFNNPFLNTMITNNDKVNFSFGYTYVGRQYYNKFRFFDTKLECPDHFNYENLEFAFQLGLDMPETIPFSKEAQAWASEHGIKLIAEQIPIANIVDLENKLFEYRKMLYRNSRDNNRAQIILH
jgi:hypothetical protein